MKIMILNVFVWIIILTRLKILEIKNGVLCIRNQETKYTFYFDIIYKNNKIYEIDYNIKILGWWRSGRYEMAFSRYKRQEWTNTDF